MSRLLLAIRGLRFHARSHASVFGGVLIATAVLTGALLMGDSVDATLRDIALARLGSVDQAISLPNRFIRGGIAEELRAKTNLDIAGALVLRGMAVCQDSQNGESTQINQVKLLGVDDAFWPLAALNNPALAADEVAVNEKLASALGVTAGDLLSLRFERPSLMALDAPLSPRGEEQQVRSMFKVKAVLPDSGAGRFDLIPNQTAPYNAFVRMDGLKEAAGLPGRVNTLLAGSGAGAAQLNEAFRSVWKAEDAGLRWRTVDGTLQLESERILLEPPVAEAALSLPGTMGTLSYLVNSISHDAFSTPYSFAVAGPIPETLKDDDAVVNSWLAAQLHLKEGDTIRVAYNEIDAANTFVAREREFTVRLIESMETLAAERDSMPEFPGLSDVERCQDWDIGMPMDKDALKDKANEAYWNAYRQTPKLLVTLRAGQEMWGNRFGKYMAVRFSGGAARQAEIAQSLWDKIEPAALGLSFFPARAQALESVERAMDFGGLFLGMSFFLIAAALLLASLLFVFSVQQRAEEMGALLVMGYRPRQVLGLLLLEGLAVAWAGVLCGAVTGTFYARFLLFGLSRFWGGAVASTAIVYHARAETLLLGAVTGFICAMGSISFAGWHETRRTAHSLLTENASLISPQIHSRRLPMLLAPAFCGLALAAVWAGYDLRSGQSNIVLSFFGVGAILLISGILLWRALLVILGTRRPNHPLTLAALTVQHIARRPGRSVAAAGLLASGVFLVLSVASMRENLAAHAGERWSGTGGFALFAQSTLPLQEPPALPEEEREVKIVPLRVRDGGDASCLNLNRAATPRLEGVDANVMAALGAFDRVRGKGSIWELLERTLPDGAIPALVGDTDTAMWGLQVKTDPETGDVLVYQDELGRDVRVKLVGSLPMRLSVFQGTLLISERNFTRLYPSENGFRCFLIDAPAAPRAKIAAYLRKEYARAGMDAVPSVERLQMFYAVESTYLGMFLVLGGLGVMLGAIGMGIVMLRNVLERRGELAMLGAIGYSPGLILRMLFTEHSVLLLAGAGIGALAALISMLPGLIVSVTRVPLAFQSIVLVIILICGFAGMGLAVLAGNPRNALEALRDE